MHWVPPKFKFPMIALVIVSRFLSFHASLLQDPGRFEVPVYLEGALPPIKTATALEPPSPTKPNISVGCCCSEGTTSPDGLLDQHCSLNSLLGGSTATFSQPNSAASSLGSHFIDGELQVASRQSSASDLGLPPFQHHHSRYNSQEGGFATSGSLSARSDRSWGDSVEALTHFDSGRCKILAPVKVLTPPLLPSLPMMGTSSDHPGGCPRMLPVHQNFGAESGEMRMSVRQTRSQPSTLSQAGTYNPYDLSGLIADFQMTKTTTTTHSSVVAGNRPAIAACSFLSVDSFSTSSSSSSSSSMIAPRRPPPPAPASLARVSLPCPLYTTEEHEPEGLVMIPGLRRVVPSK